MTGLKNDLFLRACKRQPVERTPIWAMRQAGRYLPEYRAFREKYDFLTMCKTPELASEVTIQPINRLDVDAAIVFSDILVIPEAMGMHLEMHEGSGPVFTSPIKNEADIDTLKVIDPTVELKYVLDTLALTKKELNGRVPLIGFSGSPWTLMTYMVQGQGSKNFTNVKRMIYQKPNAAHKLLDKIAEVAAAYLSAKIDAGADAVQIFDTWGGILAPEDFRTFSLYYIEKMIAHIKHKAEPVILFVKGVHTAFEALAECGADVLGLDWAVDIGNVRGKVKNRVALQGNLDPTVLYADPVIIRQKAEKILRSYGKGSGHIFNLGHGILPDVPPDHLKVLVDFVKEKSRAFH